MNYPPLRLQVLTALAELKDRVLADPDLFEKDSDIPYDGETLTILKKLMAPQVVTKVVEKEVKVKGERGRPTKDIVLSAENQEMVSRELKALMEALNSMGTGEGLETNERIQITKTKANIVEQVLKMQEREVNVKRMSDFMEVVVGILDDLIDERGRETFLKRIEPYR